MMNKDYSGPYNRFKRYARSRYSDKIESEDVAHEMFLFGLEAEKKGKFHLNKQRYSWLYLRAVRKINKSEKKTRIKLDYVRNESFDPITYELLYDFLELNCPDTFGNSSTSIKALNFKVNDGISVTFSLSDLRELLLLDPSYKDSEVLNRVRQRGFKLYRHEDSFYRTADPIAEKLGVSKSTIWKKNLATKYTFTIEK
jgi:hypothetical protein